ncbi:MAG TPA: hypothetical protein VL359_04275, partial [bacterium]|nr:hypothetical protein [bacterium]
MLKRLLKQDWDAIAGILAALAALVLHFLHVTDIDTLVAIALVLMALLLLRDFRRESQAEGLAREVERLSEKLSEVRAAVHPPSLTLIGPNELRAESAEFAHKGQGQVIWYNVCLRMYQEQAAFDILMKPFLDNPAVTAVQFVLDSKEKERWQKSMLPKIKACPGCGKTAEPYWRDLQDNISFVLVETGASGRAEALISFWGEP